MPVVVYEPGKVPVSATLFPTKFVVPVPEELANPIMLPVIVYPAPVAIRIPAGVLVAVNIRVAV